jgi:hypothetical protein
MSGVSGKVAGKLCLEAFEGFIASCNTGKLWSRYVLPSGRELNKTAICYECGFQRSVFVQNPAVKERYIRLISELVPKGILKGEEDNPLPSLTGKSRDDALQEVRDRIAGLKESLSAFIGRTKEVDTKAAEYESEARILIKTSPVIRRKSIAGKLF